MKKILVANWKMNMTGADVENWFKTFSELIKGFKFTNVEVVVAPSYLHLEKAKRFVGLLNLPIFVGAQDIHYKESGAYTSFISVKQISEICSHTILNHSETKTLPENLPIKLQLVRQFSVKPIICFVNTQDLPENLDKADIICWEDPQNITKDGIYKPKESLEIVKGITELRQGKLSQNMILYGGSVNKDTSKDLVKIRGIDGAIVGNASLDPNHFFEIIKVYNL